MSRTTVTVAAYERSIDRDQVRDAAEKRHSARTYAKSIVKRWPDLEEQERAEVGEILSPVTALETHIARVVEAWPNLTDEQIDVLRALFAPVDGNGGRSDG